MNHSIYLGTSRMINYCMFEVKLLLYESLKVKRQPPMAKRDRKKGYAYKEILCF